MTPRLQEGDKEPDVHATLTGLVRQLRAVARQLLGIDEKLHAANALYSALRQELLALGPQEDALPAGGRQLHQSR